MSIEGLSINGVAHQYVYDALEGESNNKKDIDLTNKLERGTYYTNYDIGTVIDVSQHSSDSEAWLSLYYPCKAGEKFSIIGMGGQNPRLWATTDTSFVLLEKANDTAGSIDTPTVVTISEDGYIVINCRVSLDHSVIAHSIIDLVDIDNKVNSLESMTNDLDSTINDLSNEIHYQSVWHPTYWVRGGVTTDGSENTHSNRIRSNYIPVSVNDVVSIREGYKYNVAEYSSADTSSFIVYRGMDTSDYIVKNDGFIRVGVGFSDDSDITTDTSTNIVFITGRASHIDYLLDKIGGPSAYKKNINFGDHVSGWYKGLQSSYDVSTLSVDYATFINAWDAFVSNYPDYVTKKELGDTSYIPDGTPRKAYLYDFLPINLSNKLPKIIIVAGQHGFEKANAFGLYYLCKDILENYEQSNALAYLRTHVHLMIIPFLNPFGFDTNNYYNQNHVNINRNYDSNWSYVEPGEQGSGNEPFDQPESQIVRDLINDNLDAFLYIDSHSNGGGVVNDFNQVNWHSFYQEGIDYYDKMLEFACSDIANKTVMFKKEFSLNLPANKSLGTISSSLGHGLSKSWVTEQGVLGMTLEGFNGFPGESAKWSENCIQANAEIIANWIIQVINGYRTLN